MTRPCYPDENPAFVTPGEDPIFVTPGEDPGSISFAGVDSESSPKRAIYQVG